MLKHYAKALLLGLSLLLATPAVRAQRAGLTTQAASGGGGGVVIDPTPEETPWSHLIDSLTANLNKSQIPTGILYDRALPLAGLHAFTC